MASSGGILACTSLGLDPIRPARLRDSSFGSDKELACELPPSWTLKKFQDQAKSVLIDFFLSGAVKDTILQFRELLADCPSEADELGVLAVRAALDRDEAAQRIVVELLCGLHASPDRHGCSEVLSEAALTRSFEKLFCTWEDIAIDAPKTPEALLEVLHGCIVGGVVKQSLLTKVPESLLNAGVTKAKPALGEMLAGVAAELREFKRQAGKCLEEYFVTLHIDEVGTFIESLKMMPYHHEFVKKAITLSFSQSDAKAARDAVITLLTQLNSSSILTKDDLQWGVTRVLGQLDDLELDCPRCVELSIDFSACLVADELVSVPFLRRCRLLRIGGVTGLKVIDGTLRRTPEYSKKHLGTAQFKAEVQTMILEYFSCGDEAEFGRCVRELLPLSLDKSAEMVRKIMTLAMERSSHECEQALKLLVWISRNEELDADAIESGFDDLYVRMPDVLLDVPDAEEMARAFVFEAKKAKVLREEWPEDAEP